MNDTVVVEAEVVVHRMFDRCTYCLRKEMDFICLKNKGTTQDVSFLQTPYLRNVRGHNVPEPNRALCEKLEYRTEGSVLEGTIRKLFDRQHANYIECNTSACHLVLMDIACQLHIDSCRKESFNGSEHGQKGCLDVYASFNKYVEGHEHHAVNHGLQCMQLEEKRKACTCIEEETTKPLNAGEKTGRRGNCVGARNSRAEVKPLWELSNNADIADLKLFLETQLGLDLGSLLPVKSDENILLLFKPYGLEKELRFVGRLSIKASSEPSESVKKQDEIVGFTPSEGSKFHETGVKFTFAGICYMYGWLRQLCEHLCRSHSSSKSSGFAPFIVCSIGWVMSLWSLAIHQRHLCSQLFRASPKLLPLSHGLPNKFQEDHVHPTLMEIVVGNLPDLPQEILIDIFALLEIPDLVRAGSVCSSWNSVYTRIISIGLYRRLQTPCLIYTSESAGESVACLYSLAEMKTYRLTLPEPPVHRRYLIGSSHGWLITVDEQSEMHLVNPITSEQIALPSVVTIEQVTPIFDDTGAICKYRYSQHTARSRAGDTVTLAPDKLRNHLHHKALLFHDTSAGGYLVVLIHSPYGQLSFARSGDEKWTWLPPHTHIQDCIYKDGLLYAVTVLGEIIAFNLSGTMLTTNIIMDRTQDSHGTERVYIVQAPWGDLLQVRRPEVWVKDGNTDLAMFQNNTVRMEIYKVCTAEKRLVEIKSLDGLVLFIGHNQSLCSRAEDYPQLKPNHVYFTDDARFVSSKKRSGCRLVIGVLNYETKSVEEIVFPRPWSNCHSPLLIIPNLRKMESALHD